MRFKNKFNIKENILLILCYPKRSLLRYLSPRSHAINTIIPECNSCASLIATEAAPPVLIPAKMPSTFASVLAISVASCCVTSMIRSTLDGSKIFGRYSAGHLLMPGMEESSSGWQPIIRILLFCSFR